MLTLGFLTLILFNMGCPDKGSRPNPVDDRLKRTGGAAGNGATGTGSGVPSVPPSPNSGGPAWGLVKVEQTQIQGGNPQTTNYYNANDVSRWFLSSDFSFEDVGATTKDQDTFYKKDCPTGKTCQVEFGVFQSTLGNNMLLQQAVQSNQIVQVTNGVIGLVFFDSLVGDLDNTTGKTITPIPVFVKQSPNTDQTPSFIQGNNVKLTFQDERGYIQIEGTITGNQFNGKISFQNVTNYAQDTQWRASGQLGTAQISVCAMFRCQ